VSAANTTHGATRGGTDAEYSAWQMMKRRCLNPRSRGYENYGGRGIAVCARWETSFEAFLADVGRRPSPDHSLDRFPDNDGDYEPGNVRWATSKEQCRNRRLTRFFEHAGESLTILEWSQRSGVPYRTLRSRLLDLGYAISDAIVPGDRREFNGRPKTLAEPGFRP
jgi:hypothetical protein